MGLVCEVWKANKMLVIYFFSVVAVKVLNVWSSLLVFELYLVPS